MLMALLMPALDLLTTEIENKGRCSGLFNTNRFETRNEVKGHDVLAKPQSHQSHHYRKKIASYFSASY